MELTAFGYDWSEVPGSSGASAELRVLVNHDGLFQIAATKPAATDRAGFTLNRTSGNEIVSMGLGEKLWAKSASDLACYINFDILGGAAGSSSVDYKGAFITLAALQTAFPVGQPGWFAYVGPRLVQWNPVTSMWDDAIGSVLVRDVVTPTNGQTVFALTQAPTEPTTVTLFIRGVAYESTVDFTLSGISLTWLNQFPLNPSDRVSILYT